MIFASAYVKASKVSLACICPKSAIDRGLKAGDWAKAAAQVCGGNGGGKPDAAQAGEKDPTKLHAALNAAKAFANQLR